jgi:protocatechuate 4,5-dioxygenase alpha chain
MSDDTQSTGPGFNLEAPGTYLFDGPRSTQGFVLNRFALSLKQPANRERFLRDEQAYLASYELTQECRELIRNRDWTGLLQAGGHLQALLKLAATLGQSLYHIGAHNCGIEVEEMRAACPRRVSGIGSLDASEA